MQSSKWFFSVRSFEKLTDYNDNYKFVYGGTGTKFPQPNDIMTLYGTDLLTTLHYGSTTNHFRGIYSDHDSTCTEKGLCDIGYIASTTPIETKYRIDTQKIPDNYYITITGDTVYDYSITNPETGQSDTINNYVTNNYTYVTNNNPGSGSGSGGNIMVGGKVEVGGSVGVDINVNVPDININVNQGNVGGGDNLGDYINTSGATTDIVGIIGKIPELSKGFTDYLKGFFAWLPAELYGLVVLLLVVTIWKAITKR